MGRPAAPLLGAYLWLLVLLNFVAILHAIHGRFELDSAILSAQLGLLAFWAAMGPAPWQWRLPAVLVAGAWLVFLLLRFSVVGDYRAFLGESFWARRYWSRLLRLLITCAAGRLFGFRLDRSVQAGPAGEPRLAAASSSASATCLSGPPPLSLRWSLPGTSTGPSVSRLGSGKPAVSPPSPPASASHCSR